MKRLRLDTSRISDWNAFHEEFARIFGFPTFYGRNMDAWIDCLSHLDEPDAMMTNVHVEKGDVMLLEVSQSDEFKKRCPGMFDALMDCTAFVNQRFVEAGSRTTIGLVFL